MIPDESRSLVLDTGLLPACLRPANIPAQLASEICRLFPLPFTQMCQGPGFMATSHIGYSGVAHLYTVFFQALPFFILFICSCSKDLMSIFFGPDLEDSLVNKTKVPYLWSLPSRVGTRK